MTYWKRPLDPLQIIARSHDIKLHSRVLDYTPGMWEELTYHQRKFFDWGGWLAVRPMVLGLWLEDQSLGGDEAFADALAGGLARFLTFLGASKLDAQAIGEPLLRRRAGSVLLKGKFK